jgi:hypothetical protein
LAARRALPDDEKAPGRPTGRCIAVTAAMLAGRRLRWVVLAVISMAKQSKADIALERVGEALYRDMWIARPARREYKLGKSTAELPADLKKASAVAIARQRVRTFESQSALVIHWLQHQHDLDMSARGFDPAKFEAFVEKHIGISRSGSAADRRRDAIAELLREGHEPRRGGSIRWKQFCELVEKKTGDKCDQKTIERAVRSVRRQLGQ